ncbi:hypothetical protein [sulfur-oxidizing endosymbiont of Gigantopelta aegis]|uniref:hypothetical protein n=1 Tax=sulfur-oxidizing endosymbiont of Gigantopelta aegis TaxID=2794934 RepID=UPI0018DCE4A8|nr:hypothetical protein [sulfur-oxidizing endosymbiont of Gigantopelta aegis]
MLQEKADRFAENVLSIIKELQLQGITSYKALARTLNVCGIPATNNCQWYGATAKKYYIEQNNTRLEFTKNVIISGRIKYKTGAIPNARWFILFFLSGCR